MTENEAKWEYCRAIDLIKKIKTEETHERYVDRHKAFDLAIQAIEEIQELHKIGTIEEFKALKEKSVAKKAGFDNEDGWETYICPNCGKTVGEHQKYCWNCGQAFET